ncbi:MULTISPECIES: alpha/beta hydrolase [Actinoplanes]|uniref:alpha/beta fold hydrolase n=1 Tax=Actinoplanes TaxID=1865 RepID=UPI0005F2B2FE|nr:MULTISPECIES: alpha/beta hydrolase [Actinoplanes]GLY03745.1 hydrolase [Actinoplanes sp. NBRC 101535]
MSDLAYIRTGYGAPLVLIHGLGSHQAVWAPLLPLLTAVREVITLDLPGFGHSPGPGTSIMGYADRLAQFFTEIGLDRPAVAGSSLGGGVALELGRRGHARSVTAFSPVGFWTVAGRRWCQSSVTAARDLAVHLNGLLPKLMASPAGRTALCSPFYARPGRLDPGAALADARALARAPGFDAARDAFTGLRPWRFDAPGALTRTPVTIAWGDRDRILPYRSQARRARTVLPAACHVRLPGCGHLPFSDDPQRCADAILRT